MNKSSRYSLSVLNNLAAVYWFMVFLQLGGTTLPAGRFLFPVVASLCFIFLVMKSKFNARVMNADILVMNMLSIVLLMTSLKITLWDNNPQAGIYTSVKIFSLLLLFLGGLVLSDILRRSHTSDKTFVTKVLKKVSKMFGVYLVIELSIRLVLSDFSGDLGIYSFYFFKKNSIMGADTNSLGLLIILFLLSIFIVTRGLRIKGRQSKILTNIMLFATFSRASWMALALFHITNVSMLYLNKKWLAPMLPVIVMILTLCLLYIFSYLLSDYSFRTKIGIIQSTFILFPQQDFATQVFGLGVIDGSTLYSYEEGRHAHGFFPMLLGQVGLLGASAISLFFLYGYWRSRGLLWPLIFMILTLGLSFYPPLYETTFFIVGLAFGIGGGGAKRTIGAGTT